MKAKTAASTIVLINLLVVAVCGAVRAADGFDAVKCGADVPQAVIGKHLLDEPEAATEAKHKAIGLKVLGADEVSDDVSAVSWQICGAEYLLLEDKHSVIHDALPFPAHSKASPAFSGPCQVKGQQSSDVIVAVLDNHEGRDPKKEGKALLPAKSAWKIDEKKLKFVKISEADLRCPMDGINTSDGGL